MGRSPARRRAGAGGIQGGGRAMIRPKAGHDAQAAHTDPLGNTRVLGFTWPAAAGPA
jgi:hypothetical protein